MKIKLARLLNKTFADKTYMRWFMFVNFVPKRIRIVFSTLIMTFVILISTFLPFGEAWWIFIAIIVVVSYLTTYTAIFEGINGVEWYTLFVMQVILAIALYLFYSLLPVRWLTRLPFIAIFALTYYAILLSSNILNVGVDKTLQLFRAAFSVNYLMQSFILFLIMHVAFSFRQHFFIYGIVVFIITFLLSLQLYWTIDPSDKIEKRFLSFAVSTGFILMQGAIIICFLPFDTNVSALIITAGYYSVTGLMYHKLEGTLFANVAREYIFVVTFVVVIALITLRW